MYIPIDDTTIVYRMTYKLYFTRVLGTIIFLIQRFVLISQCKREETLQTLRETRDEERADDRITKIIALV